ncbi:MAG TPA: gliding motility protein GldN [Bacteroidales bacterium]|nr:gliding motility protein GldN [Bacteroidales bacterium]
MKSIILTVILSFVSLSLFPQQTARERIEQRRLEKTKQNSGSSTSQTNRSDIRLNDILENARWSRIIYRYIDLTNPTNSPLYFPETPVDGKMNLFSTLFRSLQNNDIEAYEYLDGRESFTDEYLINFTEFLDRFDIYYETNNGTITVHDADIPSHLVQGYYLKVVYYFDTASSSLKVLPISLCPILYKIDNYEDTTRYPLFWVPYSEIEQKLRQMPAMSSSINNNMRGSIDDFFRTRMYDGEIYKTGNPGNLSISQYTNSPQEMKAEQERIEQELIDFEKQLSREPVGNHIQNNKNTKNRRQRTSVISKSNNTGAQQSMRNRRY